MVEQEQADVVCIQETKLQPDQYPEEALSTLGISIIFILRRRRGIAG